MLSGCTDVGYLELDVSAKCNAVSARFEVLAAPRSTWLEGEMSSDFLCRIYSPRTPHSGGVSPLQEVHSHSRALLPLSRRPPTKVGSIAVMDDIIPSPGIIHLILLIRRLEHQTSIFHKDVFIYQSDTMTISGRLPRVYSTTHLRPV